MTGGNTMLFAEDRTLEDLYQTSCEGVGASSPRPGTGLESRMGDTTMTDSYAMLSVENTTLEDMMYQTSEGTGAQPPRAGTDDLESRMGDTTVTDSYAILSVENTTLEDMMYQTSEGIGAQPPRAGTDDLESRMDDTTVTGSYAMLSVENTTLGDIYQPSNGVGAPPSLDYITVEAPAGMLGILLDHIGGEFTIVGTIKETSPLHGSVHVGDLLIFVDEVSCRGMSSRSVSSILSSRRENPVRTLVLGRNLS